MCVSVTDKQINTDMVYVWYNFSAKLSRTNLIKSETEFLIIVQKLLKCCFFFFQYILKPFEQQNKDNYYFCLITYYNTFAARIKCGRVCGGGGRKTKIV